ncbi:ABC transporter ATP-binding protein [Staphylococcus condimenti]|uniref:ABC transporter ATP-binding protein n=1 Tax=Staphylococcus condimenti TaxID=70255 RepID=A0A4Q7CNF1_9STAP|nr:ABC transporter ATP-binding protein [Staphylococcus condimenti]RZI00892.1 ABC transporter ATP-binding protein [Staphylococcus condimenti]RZI01663.1 ABC transporter ATP-binding protein [Staphylococcus condimenti]
MKTLLDVQQLTISTENKKKLVSECSFKIKQGETLAIIGESGIGKSLTCKALIGLYDPRLYCKGTINGFNSNFMSFKEKDWKRIRGRKIVMIMQNGNKAFNPSARIGSQLYTIMQSHFDVSKKEALEIFKVQCKLLELNDIEHILNAYPFELSGGMLQRLMIVAALAMKPEIIIADEPTTALDTITQFEVLEQLKKVQSLTDCAIVFVSHDLNVVKNIADDILVMKDGKIVESGKADDLLTKPKHVYTKYLLSSRQKVTDYFKEIAGGP